MAEIDELNWIQRIEVINEVAKLLEFLHGQEKQILILNISSSHILLDKVGHIFESLYSDTRTPSTLAIFHTNVLLCLQDYKPRLFDLLMRSQMKTPNEEFVNSTAYLQRYNFSLNGGSYCFWVLTSLLTKYLVWIVVVSVNTCFK